MSMVHMKSHVFGDPKVCHMSPRSLMRFQVKSVVEDRLSINTTFINWVWHGGSFEDGNLDAAMTYREGWRRVISNQT